MDLLHFLNRRLSFIQNLYDSAIVPFEETKRQINDGEPPYIDNRHPDDYDGEPLFLEEWQEADDSTTVVGHWCLCMVEATLQTYLRDCISPVGSCWWKPSELKARLNQKKSRGRHWFERYRLLFLNHLEIDWKKGPVSLSDIEQVNLTRNDLIHQVDMLSFSIKRDEKHAKKFPNGLFTDDLWHGLGMERLRVNREKLELAISLVRNFCTWLDGIRCEYPRYIKAMAAGEPWQPRNP